MSGRVFYIITKSTPEQFIILKERGQEVKPLIEYEGVILVFDDNLESSNNKYADQ